MKYVNLSTTYYMDPAVESLKPDAERLLTRAIAYCGNAENRGVFSYAAAARLGLRRTQSLLDQLVDAGILTLVEDSSNATQTQLKDSSKAAQKQLESSSKTRIYRFDKWDDWQESGNKLLKRQEKDRERKRREREMSRDNPDTEKRREEKREELSTDVDSSGGSAHETPEPDAPEPEPKPAPRKRSAPGTRITEDWLPTREAVEKLQPDVPLVDLKRETANFVDYWLGKPGRDGTKLDWIATWRKWMRRAQQDAEQRAQRFGSPGRSTAPGGRQPTARERKIAELELMKTNPNPEIVALGGLSLPDDHPALAQPRHLTAIEGGAA
ncbi:hypothetical protein GS538_20295 [Rhodococcus hoagii]|nr:hypothetical protein [Prescottella equi]NKR94272.1 hypothetical protein [Prescottella equi]NKS69383.1 hypothetical protein [Prescottella equi]